MGACVPSRSGAVSRGAPAGLRGDGSGGTGTGGGVVAAAHTSPPASPRPPVFFCMLSLSRSPLERCFTPKCLIIRAETVPFPEPGGPMMTARSSGRTTMLSPLSPLSALLRPRARRAAAGAPPSRGAPPRLAPPAGPGRSSPGTAAAASPAVNQGQEGKILYVSARGEGGINS